MASACHTTTATAGGGSHASATAPPPAAAAGAAAVSIRPSNQLVPLSQSHSQRRTPSASPRIHASPSAAAAAGRSWPLSTGKGKKAPLVLEEDQLDLGPSVRVTGAAAAAGAGSGSGSSLGTVQPISPAESVTMVQALQPATAPAAVAAATAAAASASTSIFTARRPSALLHTSSSTTDDAFPVQQPAQSSLPAASRARLASTVLGAAAAPLSSSPFAVTAAPLGYASAALALLQAAPSHDAADLHSTPEPQSASARLQGSPRSGRASPWPSGGFAGPIDAGPMPRSGSASRVLGLGQHHAHNGNSHGHSMLPPSSAVAAAAAAGHSAGASTAPLLKERSQSVMLPATHANEVRAVCLAPSAPLHDGHAGNGSPSPGPAAHSKSAVAVASSSSSSSSSSISSFDLSDLHRFVHTPLPRNGQQLQCTLYRDKGGSRFHPRFVLCTDVLVDVDDDGAEDGGGGARPEGVEGQAETFALSPHAAARPRRASTSASPHASPSPSPSLPPSHSHSRQCSPLHGPGQWPPIATGMGTVPGPTRPRAKRTRTRVLLYAQKASGSRYHFRVADAEDLPPSEAALLRQAMAAAATSTPTLSPLLLPQDNAACAPADAPAERIKDDARCVGVMHSNFIGNKFAFHCKGRAHSSSAAAAGACSSPASASSSSSSSPVVGASVQTWSGGAPPSLPAQLHSMRPASATASTDAAALSPNKRKTQQPSAFLASMGGASLSAFGSTGAAGGGAAAAGGGGVGVSGGGGSLLLCSPLSTTGDVTIEYELNLFSRTPRPRHLVVQIPPLRTSAADFLAGHAASLTVPLSPSSAAAAARGGRKSSSVSGVSGAAPLVLHTNQPRWNSQRNCHMLNFGGRAPVPSLKNFQLVVAAPDDAAGTSASASMSSSSPCGGSLSASSNPALVVLQLGKVSAHRFNVDARYPLTPLQAFAIALSAFDYKIAVD